MTDKLLSPWSIASNGKTFTVANKVNPDIKAGQTKYNNVVNKYLPRHMLTFSKIFYVENNGVSYFLALTKDELPRDVPAVSNLPVDDVQISIVKFTQSLTSNGKKSGYQASIKFGQRWLFLPNGLSTNPTLTQQ